VHVEEEVVPPTSNEAVEPAGGRISTKVTANEAPELPDKLMLKLVLPAVPPKA
jgi:hypothetical protein